jgi:predicted dehydrogenase
MTGTTIERQAPLRGGIIGFGSVASRGHLPVLLKSGHFSIEAVVEPDPERAKSAGRLLPGARIYPRAEDMFSAGGLDFADICTPPCFHSDLVLGALKSGLHILCEKPLTVSLEHFPGIRRAAEQCRKVVFTVNNWKHAPLWVKARELVRGNAIGPVRSVSLNVLRRPDSGGGASGWRKCAEIAGGGILVDHGWHNIYLILSLVPETPLTVSARVENPPDVPGVEETVDLVIGFAKAEARLHLTWRASHRSNSGIISGEGGTIHVNDDHLIVRANGQVPARFNFPEALSAGSHHPEWMEPVLANFTREIREPGCRGANLAEAHWCARLINLAYRSARDSSVPVAVGGLEPEHVSR